MGDEVDMKALEEALSPKPKKEKKEPKPKSKAGQSAQSEPQQTPEGEADKKDA